MRHSVMMLVALSLIALSVASIAVAGADVPLRSVDPTAEGCGAGDAQVVYSFQIETQTEIETNDTTLSNTTHVTVNSSVTSFTLTGCKLTVPTDRAAALTSSEVITIRNLLTTEETAKLISFAESKSLFNASLAISSGFLNESHLADLGESIEPIEDRIAGWLNTSVDHLEYFQIVKLTPGATAYQYSPSFDIDYTNHRPARIQTAEDLLIADAVQHHRVAAVFVFLTDATTAYSNLTAVGVRVQPRAGAAVYWPITPSDEDENDTATAAAPPIARAPISHFSEAIPPAGGSGAVYGLNVWVYPQVWRGDGEDDDLSDEDDDFDFDDDERVGLDGQVMEHDPELDQFYEAGSEIDGDDDSFVAVADSAEEDAILESFLAAAGADEDDALPVPAGEDDVDLPPEADMPQEEEEEGEEEGGDDAGGGEEEENPFLAIMEKEKAEGKAPPAGATAPPVHTEL